jgi:hypothetical protein
VLAAKADQVPRAIDDLDARGSSGDTNPEPAAQLEQSLVAQQP